MKHSKQNKFGKLSILAEKSNDYYPFAGNTQKNSQKSAAEIDKFATHNLKIEELSRRDSRRSEILPEPECDVTPTSDTGSGSAERKREGDTTQKQIKTVKRGSREEKMLKKGKIVQGKEKEGIDAKTEKGTKNISKEGKAGKDSSRVVEKGGKTVKDLAKTSSGEYAKAENAAQLSTETTKSENFVMRAAGVLSKSLQNFFSRPSLREKSVQSTETTSLKTESGNGSKTDSITASKEKPPEVVRGVEESKEVVCVGTIAYLVVHLWSLCVLRCKQSVAWQVTVNWCSSVYKN